MKGLQENEGKEGHPGGDSGLNKGVRGPKDSRKATSGKSGLEKGPD